MGRLNPYTLQMQITRMFEQGQSKEVMVVEIQLSRRDGEPVDPWLQEQANLHA